MSLDRERHRATLEPHPKLSGLGERFDVYRYEARAHEIRFLRRTLAEWLEPPLGSKTDKPITTLSDVRLFSVSVVDIGPDLIGKVAERAGVDGEAVWAYLKSDRQDSKLLDAFLFYGVGPMGKH